MAPRRRLYGCLIASILLIVVIFVSRSAWLHWIGNSLMRAGPPVKADAALVLAGDTFGDRVTRAAELERDGYVPKVFVSGPDGMYGRYECDLAIDYAVERGYPKSYFIGLRHQGKSTREEAAAVLPELRRQNVRTLDLVTSDYHSARAGSIFRELCKGIDIHVVATGDHTFKLDRWWDYREGRKTVALEWLKTVANWFHI